MFKQWNKSKMKWNLFITLLIVLPIVLMSFTVIAVSPTPTPVNKLIPGKIEAENYNAMSGIQTEACSEGTLNVGWIGTGDWMDYNVNVQTAGGHRVDYRVSSPNTTGKISLQIGSMTLATINIPNTGGWQAWTTVSTTVNLNAGAQTIRIYASAGGWNINWFSFTATTTTPTPTPVITPTSIPVVTPTSIPTPTPYLTPTPTPLPSGFSISTNPASNIASTTVTFSAQVFTSNEVIEVWYEYWETANPGNIIKTTKINYGWPGTVVNTTDYRNISGLKPNTQYNYRAAAYSPGAYTRYGQTLLLKTLP